MKTPPLLLTCLRIVPILFIALFNTNIKNAFAFQHQSILAENPHFKNASSLQTYAKDNPITIKKKLPIPNPEKGGGTMIIFAGNDTTVCLTNDSIQVFGYAENYHYVAWTCPDGGFFSNATSLITAYIPTPQIVASGLARLILVGISSPPEYTMIVDSLEITIVPDAQCFAGLDAMVCSNKSYQLQGEVIGYSEITWSTSGDGTFSDAHIQSPLYIHGTGDMETGEVLLSVAIAPTSPCVLPDMNTMQLQVIKSPEVFAGNDTSLCEGSSLYLNAQAFYYDEVLWFTNGNGSFGDQFQPQTIYYPDETDFETGQVTLTIMLSPDMPCEENIIDELLLTLHSNPEVAVGADQTICGDEPVQCFAIATNYSGLQWYPLGGNGHFDDPFTLNPTYFPAALEIEQGFCYLFLMVNPIDPCTGSVCGNFKVNLVSEAKVSAGEDQDICYSNSAQLTGEVNQYEYVHWHSAGDGYFLNQDSLIATYFPGSADIENGQIAVSIVATSASPCTTVATDTIQLFIKGLATAFAGNDSVVCPLIALTGNASNYAGSYWQSSGDGTFDNQNALHTAYHAGDQDLENEMVTLSLYTASANPCSDIAVDYVVYTFDRPAIIDFNIEDKSLFVGENIDFSIEVSSFLEITYQWMRNNMPIENSNFPTLTIENISPFHAGNYYCVYSNECFSSSSDTAFVSIFQAAEQIIGLSTGWNAISSYINPEDAEITSVFNSIIEDVVFIYSEDGLYWPGEDVQTVINWNSNIGYMVKTTDNSSLIITGNIKYPLESVVLSPGWTVVPVRSSCPVDVVALFSEIPEVTLIKEIGGYRLYWPEKGIATLTHINPGKAYEVFNASNIEISITFPGCED